MKTLRRPRLWIALLIGIAAGLIVWTLPPQPDWTAALPNPGSPGWGQSPFIPLAVSSNARYLITQGTHDDAKVTYNKIHVWDRARGLDNASIQLEGSDASMRILFSPDETQLAIVGVFVVEPNMFEPAVLLYDLASAQMLNHWKLTYDHVLFSREGKLLAVSNGVLREVETGEELRRLPKTVDRYDLAQNIGDFAVYRKDHFARLYSWHTGELQATHDLIGNHMGIGSLSRDGQVLVGSGWPPGVGPWIAAQLHVLLDGSSEVRQTSEKLGLGERVLSPDGRHLAQFGETKRPAWLPMWWPGQESAQSIRLTHWTTGTELANLLHVDNVCFSPHGNQIAAMRDDYVVDVYAFPFQTPYGLIVGAALLAAFGSWNITWLCARWRWHCRAKSSSTPASAATSDARP